MANIEIFSRPLCPYCDKAKNFFKQKGLEFKEYDIWNDPGAADDMKKRVPNARTVPQIFINGQAVGGYDDMMRINNEGNLTGMLNA